MANIRVVKLSYRVTPHLTISETTGKKMNMLDWNIKICCNKDQKITNTVINKQCWLDFWGFSMLYLNRFWYFAVSFAIFWRPGLSKQPGVSVISVLFVLERFTADLLVAFKFFNKFGINSSK